MGSSFSATRRSTKRAGQLDAHQVIDAIVARSKIAVLDAADHVLGKDRIPIPEAVGEVEAAAEALLLRTADTIRRAPDQCVVEVDAEHQIWRETGGHTGEIIAAIGADEVSDDVPPRPVALRKLVVVVRLRRGPRVLEPRLEPVLAEEPEQVNATDRANRDPLRQKIRSEEVADPTAR